MTTPRLAIEQLSAISLRDGNRPILRRVWLDVGLGEVHGLVGESGAGKSTIAKAILGIIPSQVRIAGGHIGFEGRDLLALSTHELRRYSAATSRWCRKILRPRSIRRGGSMRK